MPRKRSEQPAYQYHMSGQAKVRLGHKDFYLGKHGTSESYARYYALLAEYNANGKQPPGDDEPRQAEHQGESKILIKHITADFRVRILPRYDSNQGQHNRYDNLLKLLEKRHGDDEPDTFGPRALETLRDGFIKHGLAGAPCSRRYCNDLVRMIVKIIRHGVSRELVSPERVVALESLPPLERGDAPDRPKRKGVDLDAVKKTLPHLTSTAEAMIRIQLATAMRPSELFKMTPAMIDRSGDVWFYRPDHHKTEHHGKEKTVPILGDALGALTPYLFGASDQLCFITNKGTPWNKDAYRRAITRAAKAAKVPHWTPYQLRHTALQHVRDSLGAEWAQAMAGHSRLSTTEIYAKASEAKAIEAAKAAPKIG